MIVSIGCDHNGIEMKKKLISFLNSLGYEVIDRGTNSEDSCDYPDIGYAVAKDIQSGRASRGIVICFTGIGMSITANKVRTVRCALVQDADAARLTREHNDSNCLALSIKNTSIEMAKEIVKIWMTTEFSNIDRHQRRINKIVKIEEEE